MIDDVDVDGFGERLRETAEGVLEIAERVIAMQKILEQLREQLARVEERVG